MKISVILNSRIARTGGSLSLYNFMDKLTERGHEVYAVSPVHRERWEIGNWRKLVEDNAYFQRHFSVEKFIRNLIPSRIRRKYKSKTIPYITMRYIYDMTQRTRNIIKNWVESEVTIATKNTTALAGYWLSDRTVPLYHIMHFEEVMYPNTHLVGRIYVRTTYLLPIIIVPNSIWLQNIMDKIFNRRTPILNPGIDLDVFQPLKSPKEKYSEKKRWLIVSYFDEKRKWKGFDDAVQGVKRAREALAKKGYTIDWKVYGANPPSKPYDTDFEYVGRISLEELVGLYAEADILLMASWYESFPLPPLEAMACGTVPITSRFGTEDYAIDGETALVFLPRKIKDIADRLIYAIENPSECLRLAEAGLEMVKNFTWDKATDQLESIMCKAREEYSYKPYKFFEDLNRGQFEEYMYDVFSKDMELQAYSLKHNSDDIFKKSV